MSATADDEKAGNGPIPAVPDPQPRSGEGADTALQAMIRKRRLRSGDEDASSTDPTDPGQSSAA